MSYADRLNACKSAYPFETSWAMILPSGKPARAPEDRARMQAVFDQLLADLAALGGAAPEPEKVELFKVAVLTLNDLDEKAESLIDTIDREDLCELINLIGEAAGIPRAKYGGGEGLASEWRDW